jgi:8-oxo-dGTP diphosphatase
MNETALKPRVGSAGVLIEDDKLMMGLSKKWNCWVIPGGGVDFMESYKDTVVREIREETGIEVVWEKMIDIFEVLYKPTDNHRVIIYSNVRRVGGTIKPGDDIAEVAFFDRAGIADLHRKKLLTGVMIEVLTRFGWLDADLEAAA